MKKQNQKEKDGVSPIFHVFGLIPALAEKAVKGIGADKVGLRPFDKLWAVSASNRELSQVAQPVRRMTV